MMVRGALRGVLVIGPVLMLCPWNGSRNGAWQR